MIRIAIFASGEGSNAQRFIDYFGTTADPKRHRKSNGEDIVVSLIVSDNPKARVLERATRAGVPSVIVDCRKPAKENKEPADNMYRLDSEDFVSFLRERAGFIVLAGFLRMIPSSIIKAYPDKIVNIHPALLPNYGGKGMYGSRVHEAVIKNREKQSGITIHLVNERYDEGKILFQRECEVKAGDAPESLAARIHELEHKYYPEVVEKLLTGDMTE